MTVDDRHVCPTCDRDEFETERGRNIHHATVHGESLVRETATCAHCGDEFEVPPGSRGVYCSKECNGLGTRDRVEIECAECGDTFEAERQEAENGRRFCSQRCYGRSMSNRETYRCAGCGRKIEVQPSAGTKYCSRACLSEDDTSKPRPDDLDGLLWVLYVYEGNNLRDTWLRVNCHLGDDEWMTKSEATRRLRENSWIRPTNRAKYEHLTPADVGLDDPPDTADEPWKKYYYADDATAEPGRGSS